MFGYLEHRLLDDRAQIIRVQKTDF